ncbi:hypothetical protein DPMN_089682 [Dreissena polymorpha]|uniref:Uncharacterized protein n=1 Tax=Dreissena polymorpha TaxID=45954 RepID=A0A9D4KYC1_DREPO|nr:hypothetical protein DPMN_089682 [Dreissena polymorpha]
MLKISTKLFGIAPRPESQCLEIESKGRSQKTREASCLPCRAKESKAEGEKSVRCTPIWTILSDMWKGIPCQDWIIRSLSHPQH